MGINVKGVHDLPAGYEAEGEVYLDLRLPVPLPQHVRLALLRFLAALDPDQQEIERTVQPEPQPEPLNAAQLRRATLAVQVLVHEVRPQVDAMRKELDELQKRVESIEKYPSYPHKMTGADRGVVGEAG